MYECDTCDTDGLRSRLVDSATLAHRHADGVWREMHARHRPSTDHPLRLRLCTSSVPLPQTRDDRSETSTQIHRPTDSDRHQAFTPRSAYPTPKTFRRSGRAPALTSRQTPHSAQFRLQRPPPTDSASYRTNMNRQAACLVQLVLSVDTLSIPRHTPSRIDSIL